MQAETKEKAEKADLIEFAIRLRGVLEDKNITQAQLTKSLGLDPKKNSSRVGNWCQGKNRPRGATARLLAEALDVDVNWLLFGPKFEEKQNLQNSRIAVIQDAERKNKGSSPNSVKEPPASYGATFPIIKQIDEHLADWKDAALRNAHVASHILNQLRIHLPHHQIDILMGGFKKKPSEFGIEATRQKIADPLNQAIDEIIDERTGNKIKDQNAKKA